MCGFVALVFEGKETAREAFEALGNVSPGSAWLREIAVLSRCSAGTVEINCIGAGDGVEAAAGAASSLTAGFFHALFDTGDTPGEAPEASCRAMGAIDRSDPAIVALIDAVRPDTAALVLVSEKSSLDVFVSETESFGGRIIRSDLPKPKSNALRDGIGKPA